MRVNVTDYKDKIGKANSVSNLNDSGGLDWIVRIRAGDLQSKVR